jgi:uncharacterized protein (DUF1697 family)
MVRTAAEMAAVLAKNPFPGLPASHTLAIFLDAPPPPNAHEDVARKVNEQISLGEREIYVYYPEGQGKSRLNVRAGLAGTGRNMNTVAKLAEMAAALLTE